MSTGSVCRNANLLVDRDGYAVPSYKSKKPSSVASQCGGKSVAHLLKAVVALVVAPIDEDGSMIDTRAILAPSFKSHMGFGQGSYRRSVPSEIALGPVSAEDYSRATIAVSVATGFVLPRITNIKDADGPHEVELRSADIDVRAVLNKPKGLVGRNEVTRCFWNAPSSNNWISGIARWKGLSRSSAVVLEECFKDAVCIV